MSCRTGSGHTFNGDLMTRAAEFALLCSIVTCASPVFAQTGAPPLWSVETGKDPLTDALKVTAKTRVRLSPQLPHFYELTITCSVGEKRISIQTLDSSGPNTSAMTPRRMRLAQPTAPPFVLTLQFRYRIDNETASTATLHQAYTGSPSTGIWGGLNEENLSRLPTDRLVIADVFPDETVEFSFARLASSDRAALQETCFTGRPQTSEDDSAHLKSAEAFIRSVVTPAQTATMSADLASLFAPAMGLLAAGGMRQECVEYFRTISGLEHILQNVVIEFAARVQPNVLNRYTSFTAGAAAAVAAGDGDKTGPALDAALVRIGQPIYHSNDAKEILKQYAIDANAVTIAMETAMSAAATTRVESEIANFKAGRCSIQRK